MRHLVLVLGDQLDAKSSAFDDFDPSLDCAWMAEVSEESTYVRSHKARITLFLSAMRHFRDRLREDGLSVDYRALDEPDNRGTFADELAEAVARHAPERLIVVEPGEWRVEQALKQAAERAGVPLEIRPDRHFHASRDAFAEHLSGRKQLILETFYRDLRRATGVLMDGKRPVGGEWNYDKVNRSAFGKDGPGDVPPPIGFPPDRTTREVLKLVEQRFADHPGSSAHFDWPVTAEQARAALDDFVAHRLPSFGTYQDAMWTAEPFLYHSLLASALNLKLLDPRDAVAAAEDALADGDVPLNAAEGFIRQILGWREFVRAVYWRHMPDYLERNALDADADLPAFYWTGATEMNCLRQAIGQTLEYGYAHHIQRLMVTGLFALLWGVRPQAVHEWYLAVYVDAVEWVELPNTLGMSQYADGGVMATKPYCATGKYIQRMSDYCTGCRYRPDEALGEQACPFTTLYWNFLARNRERLAGNRRMALQLRNLDRKGRRALAAIRRQAEASRSNA